MQGGGKASQISRYKSNGYTINLSVCGASPSANLIGIFTGIIGIFIGCWQQRSKHFPGLARASQHPKIERR
jgi:hypothetical protein